MAARTKARRRALDILYAADLRGETPDAALTRMLDDGGAVANPYTAELVRGVAAHLAEIDAQLSRFSRDWTLDRMPAVDRNVLRIAVYEMLHTAEGSEPVPDHVAISEALVLVRELSTDESPPFVNGVLGAVQRDRAASA